MVKNNNLDIFIFADRHFDICPVNPCYKLVSMEDFKTNSKLDKITCPIETNPIMRMNHSYSEACRIKWLMDNYPFKDYVGTNHYRRFFEFFDNIPDMDEIFREHDAVLPNFKLPYDSVIDHYRKIHNIEDLEIIISIIKEFYPEYYNKTIECLNGKHFVPCNIFIMRKDNFIEMCDFVFSILSRYDEIMGFKTDLDVYNHVVNNMDKYHGDTRYQSRIQAFLSERLSFIYYMTKLKNPLYMDMVLTEVHSEFERSWFKLYNTDNEEDKYPFGVSVCISAWKSSEYIEECLDSVSNQTWFKENDNWEILIGIDGCNETMGKVDDIRHKYRNLRVFMMDENVGTYVTCNTIMGEAKYKWLLRFDSDDIMPEDMFEKIFSHDLTRYDVVRYQHKDFPNTTGITGCLAYGSHMIRRQTFDEYGGYRNWRISADYDLLYRIEPETNIICLDDVYYNRRIRENSLEHATETCLTSEKRKKLNYFVVKESRKQNKIKKIVCDYHEIK